MLIHHRPSLRICLSALRHRLYAKVAVSSSLKSERHFVSSFREVIVLSFVYRGAASLVSRLSALIFEILAAASQMSASRRSIISCRHFHLPFVSDSGVHQSFRRFDFRNAPAAPPLASTDGVLMFRKVALPYRAQVLLPLLPALISCLSALPVCPCHAIENVPRVTCSHDKRVTCRASTSEARFLATERLADVFCGQFSFAILRICGTLQAEPFFHYKVIAASRLARAGVRSAFLRSSLRCRTAITLADSSPYDRYLDCTVKIRASAHIV